jgi:hypothetical protein
MARYCHRCGKKLPWFSRRVICKECEAAEQAEKARQLMELQQKKLLLTQQIAESKEIHDDAIEFLKSQPKDALLEVYNQLYEKFTEDKEMDEGEINLLQKFQDTFGLTKDDVNYDERVLPYIYVWAIRKMGVLPTVNFTNGDLNIVFKKDEIVHFAAACILKEWKTVTLGYSGGSQGVSIRIAKGVTYRVGSHRGHLVKDQMYVEIARGVLVLTNQRLLFVPVEGSKQINVALNKIVSYKCYENGVELYVERREKGYLLVFVKSSAVEIFGLCLGFLLEKGV